ncbi:MAG: hypothetical protein COU51_02965 [Parcubacteria group bacterium CG10_big_fil_rev_8_21_14_0_10_36_14]|nr:MAG: hypothetical protein COU51_02965 [Parcubacteria group bacterium CG10_big_fil_rev_8_21_14_0_10_36_14]
MIILIFCILVGFFIYEGVSLIYSGVQGKWEVILEFQGLKLYITSIIPGLSVVFFGVAVIIWGLPKAIKNL